MCIRQTQPTRRAAGKGRTSHQGWPFDPPPPLLMTTKDNYST